jgi:hypothetical protein
MRQQHLYRGISTSHRWVFREEIHPAVPNRGHTFSTFVGDSYDPTFSIYAYEKISGLLLPSLEVINHLKDRKYHADNHLPMIAYGGKHFANVYMLAGVWTSLLQSHPSPPQ